MSDSDSSSSPPSAFSRIVDSDGDMTPELETCLQHIFAKYCYPPPEKMPADAHTLLIPPSYAWIEQAGLDKFAVDTNGEPFSEETKLEIIESFDTTDDNSLTLKGFMQMYELQTSNDEEETWHDLDKHGFDRTLHLTSKAYALTF